LTLYTNHEPLKNPRTPSPSPILLTKSINQRI
jgi:hypothetical protein